MPDLSHVASRLLFQLQGEQITSVIQRPALKDLNVSVGRDGLQAYFDGTGKCHLRNLGTEITSASHPIKRRAWTDAELKKRMALSDFFDEASEDDFIEQSFNLCFSNLALFACRYRVTVTRRWNMEKTYG